MNPDPLHRLWQLKRQAAAPVAGSSDSTSPALVTRIAAAWAGQGQSPLPLLERVTACSLVVALAICGIAVWQQPARAPEPDALLSLFTARPAPQDDFPF